jgi:hypothetical protein
LLLERDPPRWIQPVPVTDERREPLVEPGVGIRSVNAVAGTASPDADALKGSLGRRLSGYVSCKEVAVKVPVTLLLANDHRSYSTPDVGVKLVKRSQPLLGAQPEITYPTS